MAVLPYGNSGHERVKGLIRRSVLFDSNVDLDFYAPLEFLTQNVSFHHGWVSLKAYHTITIDVAEIQTRRRQSRNRTRRPTITSSGHQTTSLPHLSGHNLTSTDNATSV